MMDDDLVRAVVHDQWTRKELVEDVMFHMTESVYQELLKQAKAEGYYPREE